MENVLSCASLEELLKRFSSDGQRQFQVAYATTLYYHVCSLLWVITENNLDESVSCHSLLRIFTNFHWNLAQHAFALA